MISTPESGASKQESGEIKESQASPRKIEDFDVAPAEFNRAVDQLARDFKEAADSAKYMRDSQNFPDDEVRGTQQEASKRGEQLSARMQEGVDQGFILPVDTSKDSERAQQQAKDADARGLPELAKFSRDPSSFNYNQLEKKLASLGFERAPISFYQKDYFVRVEQKRPKS